MFLHPSVHIEIAQHRPMSLENTETLSATGVVSDSTRELAQRLSGTVEVLLLWHPEVDRVELSLRDTATDVRFHLDVAPGNAIDAFYHPYVYAYAASRNSHRAGRAEG